MFALNLIDAIGTQDREGDVRDRWRAGSCWLCKHSAANWPEHHAADQQLPGCLLLLPTYVWSYWRSNRTVDLRFMRVAFSLFLASVVYDNLAGFGLVRTLGLEPFGFLIQLTAMGVVTAQKSIASEQKLLAVEREWISLARFSFRSCQRRFRRQKDWKSRFATSL